MKKIIITVGPSSHNKDTIQKIEQAGVGIFRINLSHTPLESFEKMVLQLQEWTSKTICLDTEGAQLRTGVLSGDGKLILESYERIKFIFGTESDGKINKIPLNINPQRILKQGDLIKIDFNSVVIQITEIFGEQVFGRVIVGGMIGTNKGVSVDREIRMPAFSKKDLAVFKKAKKLGLKTIALSFASCGDDIVKLRNYFDYEIEVISKVESKIALNNIESICSESDAVLIDRGDLSRDVPLEKIIFAQQFIIDRAKELHTPVYVATNLMENMITNSKPTRAEVHDIVETVNKGIDGLVLAAETAIGKYPVECVRIMSRIVREFYQNENGNIDYLTSLPSDRMIEPHGGVLIQQHKYELDQNYLKNLPAFSVNHNQHSDIIQMTEGVYSPISSFMGLEELDSVLDCHKLLSGISWSLPILLQINEEQINNLPSKGEVGLYLIDDHECFAVIDILSIEKMENMDSIAKRWFETLSMEHPGVSHFLNNGHYLVRGIPYLVNKKTKSRNTNFELTPRQTRQIINDAGWHNIVGFHTRNVPHQGHEYIQKKALEMCHGDALFISPVIGKKKSGDFKGEVIIKCYQHIIQSGFYEPNGVLLVPFNTYSRYSGPREAVFTVLCRKNYGCNHFIVGRDHTGVKDFYDKEASIEIFKSIETGLNIVSFDSVNFCIECGEINVNCVHSSADKKSISGSQIRDTLLKDGQIPWYMMRKDSADFLREMYLEMPESILER